MTLPEPLRDKLKTYFSGKLALVQIGAGVGALAGRSAAVYLMIDEAVWTMVTAGMIGSFAGYICLYVLGYWLAFRDDYRVSGRTMSFDVLRLQLVEQSPNIGSVIGSALTQGALIGGTSMPPVLAANLASWFGPQKLINLAAMATSNSLKRAMVDGSWNPVAAVRNLANRAMHPRHARNQGTPDPVDDGAAVGAGNPDR